MSVITVIILIFALLGALDRILGNRFGLGKEFERGFQLFGAMALSMIGMIIIAPALGVWLKPMFEGFYRIFGVDPSIIPAAFFANDMGGASLAMEIAKDESIGMYNAFVVSSMMGCVISFTIPFASGIVPPERHKDMYFGFLCGIVTIPVGCIVAGFMCGLSFLEIVVDLLPLLLISGVIAVGLIFVPVVCVKIFRVFGEFIKIVITLGLALGIFTFLTGKTVFVEFETLEEGARICVNACVTLAGAFPFMFLLGKLLNKPMSFVGKKLGINSTSALALIPTLVTNATTSGMMKDMDQKGTVLNSAFAVSAAFALGGHMGFTMAYDGAYVLPMVVGKVISGIAAVAVALLIYRDGKAEKSNEL
jgi:ethanolamine transporter